MRTQRGVLRTIQKDWQVFLLAALISLSLVYCLYPLLAQCSSRLFHRDGMLTVTVDAPGAGGGTEVWIARPHNTSFDCDLSKVPQNDGEGMCEYRLAADYGYGYDFLISYGENLEAVLQIPYEQGFDSALCLYCHPAGGVITWSDGNESRTISTYAESPLVQTISLRRDFRAVGVVIGLAALLWLAGAVLLYLSFERKFWVRVASVNATAVDVPTLEGQARNSSIDLLKAISAFLVIYVHSFLAATAGTVSYYNSPLTGGMMFAMTFMRWVALCCVPLFMVLSGYLCIHSTSLKNICLRLLTPMLSFLMIMGLHLLLSRYYFGQTISVAYALNCIVGMDLSWYLEMYIGLSLLMPFLNTLWAHLSIKNQNSLVLMLLLLTSVGSVSNRLLPTYWEGLYPIMYYFVGAWIRERDVHWRCTRLFIALSMVFLLETIRTFADVNGGLFSWSIFGGYQCSYNAGPVILATVLIVLLFYRVNVRFKPFRWLVEHASRHSLSIYLISVGVTDSIFYAHMLPHFPTAQKFFPVQLPLVSIYYVVVLFFAMAVDQCSKSIWNFISHNRKKSIDERKTV